VERVGGRPAAPPGPSAPRVPRQRRAFSTLGGPIELGGDPAHARALGALLDVDPALARALTHGFHSYAGRMHPSIARGAITRLSRPGERVLDPFCGSGTVLVEAVSLGRQAVGVDASPLGVAIALVRTTVLSAADRRRLIDEAARIAQLAGQDARKRRRPPMPTWGRRELERFAPHVLLELLVLREQVLAVATDDVGRAVQLCFSSILVKLMKAGPEAPRDGGTKRIARGAPSRLLADRAAELANGLEALERRVPPGTPPPRIKRGDARSLDGPDASVDLIVSSPPYAGTYDYVTQHDARFTWLDLPRAGFDATQIGARADTGFGADPAAWRDARRRWLAEMQRVLRPGGYALLVVGDGIVGAQPEDAADAIADAVEGTALMPIARASQARPTFDRRLRAIFAGRPRREHLLLLQRR